MNTIRKNIIIFLVGFSVILVSCKKTDQDDQDSPQTLQFTNHWFFDFNGTIDGGEGFDIIKSSADGKVYVCGAFLHVNENWDMKNLVRWISSENKWEKVPGIDYNHSNFIRCVAEGSGGDLFFGGDFSMIGGSKAYKIGRFSPSNSTWSALRDINYYDDAQQYGPVGGGVYAVAVSDDYIYIGGGPFTTDSVELRYIRRFNLTTIPGRLLVQAQTAA